MEETEVVSVEKPAISSGEKIAMTVGEIVSVIHAGFVVKRWVKFGIGALRTYNANR